LGGVVGKLHKDDIRFLVITGSVAALFLTAFMSLPASKPVEFPPSSTLIFRSGTTTVCSGGVTQRTVDKAYTCRQADGEFTVSWGDVSAVKVPHRKEQR
jgi:hypothetical protein